jgi:hypothetical protein
MESSEKELFDKLKQENAKLVKWWEREPVKPVGGIERRGVYNALTGEVEE